MNIFAFICFLFILQLICFWVGSRSTKNLKTQEDYFLASKSLKFFPLMMTFLATQIGGGLVLGSSQEAYQFGWSVLFYPLGASLGLILLGTGIGRKLAQFQVSTIAEIFEVAYRSTALRKIASLLSIISLFMILVAQIIASHKFMINLGVDNNFLFIVFWGIVIAYTTVGGLKAVVLTDIVQAGFFIGAFLLCFVYALFYSSIPFSEVIALGLNQEQFDFDLSKLYGWLFMPLLFMVIEQDMGQRCFAAQSPKMVSRATLCAALFTFGVCLIPVYFGVLAQGLGLNVTEGSSVLMGVIEMTTTPLFAALIGCAILAAIISTADSLINAISSNLSQDFNLSLFRQKSGLRFSQAMTAAIALAAILSSFWFNNVVDLLIQSYELSVCCLFVPITIAIFKRSGNSLSAWLSIAFGAAGVYLFRAFPTDLPKELLSVLLSLSGYGIGELILFLLRGQSGVQEQNLS